MRSAVLAGGTASRFGGRPKGLEKVGGVRILDRVVEVATVATGASPVLVANAPEAQQWIDGIGTVADIVQNAGSLGGIYTAVSSGEGPVLVVAWDMPFLTVELVEALVNGAGDYDIFLPESTGPLGVEPLCAIYGPGTTEPIQRSLLHEDLRSTKFHDEVRRGTLPLDEVRAFGDPDVLFFNVNDPQDLQRAEELWRGQHETPRA
jgi:molybdopterin-guanine dinucleotide biosynthesis protein A